MFDQRRRAQELMDDPNLPLRTHRDALRGLKRINKFSGTVSRIWKAMLPHVDPNCGVRVIDIGCGGGDILFGLAERATHAGIRFYGVGCDISPTACQLARESQGRRPALGQADIVRFVTLDCVRDELPEDVDVAFCSLFLHHLDETDAVTVLSKMKQVSRQAVVVDDLIRSAYGYALAWAGTRVLSRSHVVHVDGPLSVTSAFMVDEALRLAELAGMESAKITTHWPCRFQLHWSRS